MGCSEPQAHVCSDGLGEAPGSWTGLGEAAGVWEGEGPGVHGAESGPGAAGHPERFGPGRSLAPGLDLDHQQADQGEQ